MMRVGMITTWAERCGIAEYAKNLIDHARQTEFKILTRNTWNWPGMLTELQTAGVQVAHVNYEPGLFRWLESHMIHAMRGAGIKTVLTLHTTTEGNNRGQLQDSFDRVVVHERTTEGYQYIPQGILDVTLPDTLPTDAIGTAGFPFSWKGFHQVAQAAGILERGCTVIASKSDHIDTEVMERFVMQAQPRTEYIKDWLTSEQVIGRLRNCAVNVFAYSGAGGGISGAVRFGISARRPLVLTRCRQFRDLYEYEDEIEFIEGEATAESIAQAIERVEKNGKVPKRVLQDMSWERAAGDYEKIYGELLAV